MTVAELIEVLRQIADPEDTLVVISESEVDEPCEFVALDELICA